MNLIRSGHTEWELAWHGSCSFGAVGTQNLEMPISYNALQPYSDEHPMHVPESKRQQLALTNFRRI
jgi:hypothetical protein